jgi:microcystin-dependent protein
MTVTGDITINGNNNIITKGMIVAFSPVATGSNESIIPTGWAICDGTNGTPDLRAKFVMGASDITPILSTGGSTTVDITAKHIPTHTHTYDMKSKMYTNQPQYVLNIKNIAEYNIMQKHPKLWIDTKIITANTSNAGGKSVVINPASAITTPLNTATITTSPDTVISTLSILPPYYTLVYIQKL